MAIIKYDGGGKPGGTVKDSISYDGGKTWNGSGASGAAPSGSSSGTSKTGQSSGWNNYTAQPASSTMWQAATAPFR